MLLMLSREEFDRIYQLGPDACFELLSSLAARISALEEKLAPKPHAPSASQPFLKPMSQRPKTDRKSGGQKGHKGHTLQKTDTPDQVQQHRPDPCPRCGLSLADAPTTLVESRQVVDLPSVMRYLTVEHQVLEACCPGCQCQVKADFPEGVQAPVQYGPNLMATCVLLRLDQSIALNRIVSFLTDWFGHSPSEGTIDNWQALAYRRLAPLEEQIAAGIAASQCAGFDETMVRTAGKNHWIHVARTDTLTHLSAPGGRGKEAMKAAGILPAFRGVAVHDAWSGYFSFPECAHSLCGAHLLREGDALRERFDPEGRWSEPILGWLRSTKKRAESGCAGTAEELIEQVRSLVGRAYRTLGLSPPDSDKKSACSMELTRRVRWLDRLWFYAAEVSRFGWDLRVPFDNNGSERDIRPVKRFSKVFGCWRSKEGLARFCRIRGYLSTMHKQGISVRAAMISVFRGNPVQPIIPAPLPA